MSVAELVKIIDSMNELHLSLLETAQLKQQVLIHNDVEHLNQVIHSENKLLKKIGDLEQQRIHAVNQYLLKRGFRPDPRVTISDLVTMVFKSEDKQALKSAQHRLSDTLIKLKRKNELNQQLIEQSLLFIDYSLDIFIGSPEDDVIYHNPQQQKYNGKRPGIFDAKA